MPGLDVRVGANQIANPARRWAVALDDGTLVFADCDQITGDYDRPLLAASEERAAVNRSGERPIPPHHLSGSIAGSTGLYGDGDGAGWRVSHGEEMNQ
jgi:hypothetical protein